MENKLKIIKEFFKYFILIIEALGSIIYMLLGGSFTLMLVSIAFEDDAERYSSIFEIIFASICYIMLFVLGLAFLIEIILLTYCFFEKKKFNEIFLISTAALFFIVCEITLFIITKVYLF